jgi:flagellin-like protein
VIHENTPGDLPLQRAHTDGYNCSTDQQVIVSEERKHRGVSPVVGVVLLVGIVVVLSATIGAFVFGIADGIGQTAPQVAQSSAEFRTQDGFSGGVVSVTHEGGDPVTVADVTVVIDTSDVEDCNVDEARILNLPATARFGGTLGYADDNLARGDNSPISQGSSFSQWSAGALHTDTGPESAVGDSFAFRLTSGECPVDSGETVRVTVVHNPSSQRILSVTATA